MSNFGEWADPLLISEYNSGFTKKAWWIPQQNSAGYSGLSCPMSLSDVGTYEIPLVGVYNWLYAGSNTFALWAETYPAGYPGCLYVFNFPSFSAGDKIHLAAICDVTAAIGHRLRLFVNGAEQSLSTIISDVAPTFSASYVHYDYTGVCPGNGWGLNGDIIDNLQTDNSVDTDFSGRFWQDEQGVPTGIAASQGTYPDHVEVSWSAVVGILTGYQVYRASSSGGSYSPVSVVLSSSTLSWSDTTAFPGIHYFYKIVSITAIATSAMSAYSEGWESGTPPPPEKPLVYDVPAVKNPRIIINGYDVYKAGLIAKLFNVQEEKTFKKSKLIFNDFSLDANNFNNDFSRDNPRSIFYGKRLYLPVQIYNRDAVQIFSGVTLNLTRNHVDNTASREVADSLATYSRTKITYQSADWETPALAVKNIMDAYGAAAYYDLPSIMASDALYRANNAYIRCDVRLNANCYLTGFIEKIAEIGCADAYIHNNLIRFDHWHYFTRPASSVVNVDISHLLSAPKIEILFSEIVNDYRVRYNGDNGIATTDADNNNIGVLSRQNLSVFSMPEIRSTDTSQVQIKDLTTAVYFGECLIRRTHTGLLTNPNPLQTVEIELPIQDREWLDITSHIALTFPEEGWNSKIFEIMKILFDDDANKISLTCYEISS